ncbi:short chain dehydrogenase [Xylariales sp. AK1849]|nr:short chain dehydrogenase [Xylariales sp. AK1849]
MSRIFITGSSDGLGLLSAQALASRGHQVFLHARSPKRAEDARRECPQAAGCLIADLSSTEETKSLASQVNENGPWDAIIHNAGVMRSGPVFAINTMAPYLLTCLIDPPPKRYVFLSSQMHQSGDASLRNIEQSSYSDSKLHNIMLAFWFARHFGTKVACNSMDPGWVATKMGGAGAPDDIDAAVETYAMLAEGKGAAQGQTGKYWYQSGERKFKTAAGDEQKQNQLIGILQDMSGIKPTE